MMTRFTFLSFLALPALVCSLPTDQLQARGNVTIVPVTTRGFEDNVIYARNFEVDSRDVGLQARGFEPSIVELEARKGGGGIGDVVEFVVDIVKGIKDQIAADNSMRDQFTKKVVSEGRAKKPDFNWVVCHVKHETHFDGTRGTDWDHRHEEVDIKIGGTIGYEIFWLKSGTFKRIGDGGYINWAWGGVISSVSGDGKEIHFVKPS